MAKVMPVLFGIPFLEKRTAGMSTRRPSETEIPRLIPGGSAEVATQASRNGMHSELRPKQATTELMGADLWACIFT